MIPMISSCQSDGLSSNNVHAYFENGYPFSNFESNLAGCVAPFQGIYSPSICYSMHLQLFSIDPFFILPSSTNVPNLIQTPGSLYYPNFKPTT